MAIYTSKFTQQEIDDGIDNANSAVQPDALNGYLPLSGGTMNAGARIQYANSGTKILYIGRANNAGWVAFQDICSQDVIGDDKWSIRVNGKAVFANVSATAYNNTSDIRKKDIIENLDLDVKDIANAPIFKFTWLDPEMPEGVNVGTSAQYWKTIIPEIVSEANDDEKTLSMQYGVAGLASSIALAKKVVEQEKTIKAQEARIKALEDAIAEIQNKLK